MEPSALLEKLRAHDPKAFRAVYDQHWKLVVHILRSYRIPIDRQDDLVQDVFLKFFKNVDHIQSGDKIKSWIATTTRNRALDEIRTNKSNPVDPSEQSELEKLSDHHDAAETVDREIQAQVAEKFIGIIANEPGAQTLTRFYIDGKSAKEIAQENAESISAVTTRLTRLRRKFQDTVRTLIENEQSSLSSRWENTGE